MKKRLWVSRDACGYNVWKRKPILVNDFFFDGIQIRHIQTRKTLKIDSEFGIVKTTMPTLKLNQLKRIELTIKAEVKEL
jgi:hypothetical protein